MGLDAVELVLAFEEEFKLDIPDEDAQNLTTPDEVTDYLMRRLGVTANTGDFQPCLTQQQFHHLRRILMHEFGITRQQIHLQTPMHQLIRLPRIQWPQLAHAIGRRLPWLGYTRPVKWLLHTVPLLALMLLLHNGVPLGWAIVLGLITWVAGWVCIGTQIASIIPVELTVSSLLPYLPRPDPETWSRQQILQLVLLITSEQLSIPIKEIRPEHRFVEDLGAG